jgi:tRNA pseudouridine13 synthase
MVSKRIAKYGLQPVIGDLVYPREEEVEEELEDAADGESGTVAEEDKMEDTKEKKKVQPLVLDESNIGNYNMYDVVLPLPGYDVIYPANEVAQWYNEQLETDEMSGFKQNVK